MAQDRGNETDGNEVDRRAFLKKMAAIAFVAPVISSFTLDAAAAADSLHHPNQFRPNQYIANQYVSNVFDPDHFHPNMFHPNMHHPNQETV